MGGGAYGSGGYGLAVGLDPRSGLASEQIPAKTRGPVCGWPEMAAGASMRLEHYERESGQRVELVNGYRLVHQRRAANAPGRHRPNLTQVRAVSPVGGRCNGSARPSPARPGIAQFRVGAIDVGPAISATMRGGYPALACGRTTPTIYKDAARWPGRSRVDQAGDGLPSRRPPGPGAVQPDVRRTRNGFVVPRSAHPKPMAIGTSG